MRNIRRISTVLLLVGLTVLLIACGGKDNGSIMNNNNNSNTNEQDNSIANTSNGEEDKDVIEVDKNLFSVKITIPASFLSDGDPEQIKAEAEQEEGIKEVTINNDGSITYEMSKAAHKRMIDEMKQELEGTIEEIKNSSDFPSIIDIMANKSYTEFTMVVEREKYENSFDGFAVLGLGMGSMFYQVFEGTDVEKVRVTIHVEDSKTGETFDTIVFPDELNES